MSSRSLELEFRKGNKKISELHDIRFSPPDSHDQTHTQPLSQPSRPPCSRSAGMLLSENDHAASAPAPARLKSRDSACTFDTRSC